MDHPHLSNKSLKRGTHDSKLPTPYHCEVCNVVTCDSIRCGVYACEACKKFFLRNRNNQNLQCVTGLNNCTFGDENTKALVSASGKFWRMLCPKCRLAKCKAVGMRMVHRNADNEVLPPVLPNTTQGSRKSNKTTSPLSTADSTQPSVALIPVNEMKPVTIVENPLFQQSVLTEESLRAVVYAGRELMMAFELLPLRNNNDLERCNEIQAFQAGLHHFECIVKAIKVFVAQIPGYSSLAVEDRCVLFASSTPTITIAATNKRAPTMCGLSPVNGATFVALFPEFEYSIKESAHMWNAMANWNPSPAEFSLLLTLLFYQASIGLSCYEEASQTVIQFKWTLHAYLEQCFGSNQVYVENRIRQLGYLLDLMQEAGMRRNFAFAELKQRCPYLFTLNRYLAEIHDKNKESYNNIISKKSSPPSVDHNSASP